MSHLVLCGCNESREIMCGFFAAFIRGGFPDSSARMALDRLYRRGPDDEGEWQDERAYLGHRRLAILDLDHRAAQPMQSECGRYVIVFNGEIYNFRALKRDMELQGTVFRTQSDTEVILALYASQGAAMLPKLQGMFAFVIWDREQRKAFAARDPYGIKPLYVGTTGTGVLLASQVKALLATGLISGEADLHGQAGFWMLGSVPEPHTWYKNIRAVQAGHCLWIQDGKITDSHCWHDIGSTWREVSGGRFAMEEVREVVRSALRESVKRHLVADVPVGVFLSGGIDSGALAGLMVEAGARDLEGITISYDEFSGSHEDEAPVAAELARHYGIRHHIRRVTRDEFLEDLPRIFDAMDQPSIDGVNTWYASKAVAERGLKVVVSGVGGDELFLGYGSFRQLPRLVKNWSRLSAVPGVMPLARLAGNFQARRSRNNRWNHAPDWARTIAGAWWLRRSIHSPDELTAFLRENSVYLESKRFDVGELIEGMVGPLADDTTLALAQIESMTYMRNQLLRDSDWASMDHSVELRTPLIDALLLEKVKEVLPMFCQFPNKSLLAGAPGNPLPPHIVQRKKTGFGIPVQRWLAESNSTGAYGRGWAPWMREIVNAYG